MVSLASLQIEIFSKIKGHWEGSHYVKVGAGIRRWTKWSGGAIYSVDTDAKSLKEEWYCQSCSDPQPAELTPFRVQFEDLLLRVCAKCFKEGCTPLKRRLQIG